MDGLQLAATAANYRVSRSLLRRLPAFAICSPSLSDLNSIGTWPSGQSAKTLASMPGGLCRLSALAILNQTPKPPEGSSWQVVVIFVAGYVRQKSDAVPVGRIKSSSVQCRASKVRLRHTALYRRDFNNIAGKKAANHWLYQRVVVAGLGGVSAGRGLVLVVSAGPASLKRDKTIDLPRFSFSNFRDYFITVLSSTLRNKR